MKGLVIKCSKCNFANDVMQDSALIKHKVPFICEGKTIYLTSFTCSECGNVHYVQIDNDETIEDYNKCYQYMVKLSLANKKNRPFGKKDVNKFKNLRAKLNQKRLELMKEYDGKIIYDKENNSSSVLSFTLTN